jgi:LysR family nitrogen assimilation transcriptional regulator
MTLNLRQLRAFVAVFEEGSFNKAARRDNATQSGLSALVGNLEAQLGVRIFDRTTKGIVPTQAGERLYRRSSAILRDLSDAESEMRLLAGDVAGRIRIGLIPAVTHSFLAAVLDEFFARYPAVDITIVEAYSPALTEGVARKEFDFAVVPFDRVDRRSRSSFFGRDSELLISGPRSPLGHSKPVRLRPLPPLRLILPTHGNARRERLEAYFAANGVRIDKIVDLDSMAATLELVAESDFMTIVPTIFMRGILGGGRHKLHPIVSPTITVDFAVIRPRGQVLSLSAKLFLEMLTRHFETAVQPEGREGRRRARAEAL